MSETKFTPGPWLVYERAEPVGYAQYEIHHGVDTECVAEIVHEKADALLIAAAPELYAALDWLEVSANTVDGCYTRNPANFASALNDLREAAERAREALAEVSGQL